MTHETVEANDAKTAEVISALFAGDPSSEQSVQAIRDLNPGAAVTAVEAPGLSPDSPVYRIE